MLVVRFVGSRAPGQKFLPGRAPLFGFVCVVIVHLMIIPGNNPRKQRMRLLQVGVRPVLRVAIPVFLQRLDLAAVMLPDAGSLGCAFVDVITEVNHQIEILGGHVAV